MKKLVAWKEEPVMETSAENEETVNRADMGRDEKPTFEEDIDKPIVKSERRPTKKDIDREEGRKGSERRRRESRYKEDSHRSSSSHRPTESNPSTHSSERRSTIHPCMSCTLLRKSLFMKIRKKSQSRFTRSGAMVIFL